MRRFHHHRSLAARLAAKYTRHSNHDDVRQVADLALVMASRRYDPVLGPFERFAVSTIIGELKKYLRTTGWAVRVPRRLQEDALTVAATVDRLTVSHGRSPRLSEVGSACGLSPERVTEALRAGSARYGAQHDDERYRIDDESDRLTRTIAVRAVVANLDDDARALLAMIFDQGLTQREAAARLSISQSQIQRNLIKILASLEQPLLSIANDR
ncbi:MAG: sigma-70 family RNA polymerase sigma factor [Aquihabitans sp.]